MKKAEIWICKNLGCNKQFKHRQSLQNHKLNCGLSSSVKCPVCFKSFARSWYLKSHKCKQKESLECSQCSKVFPKVWHLKRHIKNVHAKLKKELKCSTCERQFSRQDFYDKHKCSGGGNKDTNENIEKKQGYFNFEETECDDNLNEMVQWSFNNFTH
eukprot:TCONS_00040789-protein